MTLEHLSSIVGDRIVALSTGCRQVEPGLELRGVSTSRWIYASLLVELASGRVVSLEPGEVDVLPDLRVDHHPEAIATSTGETAVGREVLDVLAPSDGEPAAALWLSGDLLLQHHYLPGGSVYALDAIAEAASADLGSWRSLISGEVRTL